MKNRLNTIYSYINSSIGIIDVGTDHAYIPILLAQNRFSGNIIASDINSAPLNKAMENAEKAGIKCEINFKLSDGLKGFTPDMADCIIIAGMGGDVICSILDCAEQFYVNKVRFILQPMTKAEILRYWLVNNGFSIIIEDIVKENNKLFQIIVCEFTGLNSNYRGYELYIGSLSLNRNNDLYYVLARKFSSKFTAILNKTTSESSFYKSIVRDLDNIANTITSG